MTIITPRLDLVPASIELVRAAMKDEETLGAFLGARVPPSWPHEYLDEAAWQFTLVRLTEEPDQVGWWTYFAVLRESESQDRTLIGSGGFKGPPSGGLVELGYGVVLEYRRQGLATEIAGGLLSRAFRAVSTQRVIAETRPELAGSQGVLRRCGFHYIGPGSEPGTMRYEITRTTYEALVRSGR